MSDGLLFDWEAEGLGDVWPRRVTTPGDRRRIEEHVADEEWRLEHGFPEGYVDPDGVMRVDYEPDEDDFDE